MKRVAIQFVQEGEKVNKTISSIEDACDWEMQVDSGGKLVVPQEIASTNLRPDIVLWSRSRMRQEAARGALRVNRFLEEARKKSRIYLS